MKRFCFLITAILLSLFCASCFTAGRPTNGIYLIPKGFVGGVIIFFDQPDGVTPDVENGRYVYRIPIDGVLKVRSPGVTGFVRKSYYYVDENQERREIETLRVTGDRDPMGRPQSEFGDISDEDIQNKVFVMNEGGLGSFNLRDRRVQYTTFIVSTPMENSRLYHETLSRIFDYQMELIRAENGARP